MKLGGAIAVARKLLVQNCGQNIVKYVNVNYLCTLNIIYNTHAKETVKRLAIILIFAVFGCHLSNLHAAPAEDKAIYTKTLPCGIKYYIVTNTPEKMSANMALVVKNSKKEEFVDSLSLVSEPAKYLRSKAIAAKAYPKGKSGYIYSFENLNLAKKEIVDSTLLLIYNIIADASPERSFDEYAIVVSGDVDKKAIEEKIRIFGYMLQKKVGDAPQKPQYEFTEQDGLQISVTPRNLDRITFTFKAPRRDLSDVSPLVPLFSEKLYIETGAIIRKRFERAFKRENMPYMGVQTSFVSSSETDSDVQFAISVDAASENLGLCTSICAHELASIGKYDFSKDEIHQAETYYYRNLFTRENISNRKYVDVCADNFLFNGLLISPADKIKYLSTKVIADTLHNEMMLEHIREVVKVDSRLKIDVCTTNSDLTADYIRKAFDYGWALETTPLEYTPASETIDRSLIQDKKAIAIPLRTDVFYGGPIMVCTNGIEVFYKPMPKIRRFHVLYAIPNNIFAYKNIPQGAAGHMASFITQGVEDYITANDITLVADVSEKELWFEATTPKEKLDSLFMLLSTLTNNYKVDGDALEYYKQCHSNDYSLKATLDSLLFPKYNFTTGRSASGAASLTKELVEEYLKNVCANRTKGKVLIVGPDNEDLALREVGRCLSSITAIKGLDIPKSKTAQPSVKTVPYIHKDLTPKGSETSSLAMMFTFKQALDSDFYFRLQVVSAYLRNEIGKILAATPYIADCNQYWDAYPENRYYFVANIQRCPVSVVSAANEELTLQAVQEQILKMIKQPGAVSAADLEAVKAHLTADLKAKQNSPSYWLNLMNMRRVEKKNINTRYEEKIKAITTTDVADFVKKIAGGETVVLTR